MRNFIVLLALVLAVQSSEAQVDTLRIKIENLIKTKSATVGVSIIGNNFKDTVLMNGGKKFPMQSVFKFPIALAVLAEADKGKFTLDKKIKITEKDLLPGMSGPIRDKYPHGTTLTIAQIIEFTIEQSDNSGCDLLLKLVGGPSAVEKFLHENNFNNISIKTGEAEMQKDGNAQFSNWTMPEAMSRLLVGSFQNKNHLLSDSSYNFIWNVMRKTSTGQKRLKGQLPPGTIVAHKTGTSGTKDGITTAVNDVGVVTLPGNKHFFISVFVSNSKEKEEVNEKIISDIAKLAWDYFK